MDLHIKKHHNWVVVDLNGRVDSFNYEIIKDKVNTLVKMGNRFLAFNLEGVQFIALPNLRFLIQLGRQLDVKGGRAAIVGSSEEILNHFLEVNGLATIDSVGVEDDLKSLTSGSEL